MKVEISTEIEGADTLIKSAIKANYELRKPPKKNIVFFDISHANFIASKFKIKPDQYTTICSRL